MRVERELGSRRTLLTVVMALSFVACGGNSLPADNNAATDARDGTPNEGSGGSVTAALPTGSGGQIGGGGIAGGTGALGTGGNRGGSGGTAGTAAMTGIGGVAAGGVQGTVSPNGRGGAIAYDAPIATDGPAGGATGDLAFIPPPTFVDAAILVAPADASAAVADTCTKSAAALCDKIRVCAPAGFASSFQSLAACIDQQTRTCRFQLTLPGIEDYRFTVDSCAVATVAQNCAEWSTGLPPACRIAARGMLAEGSLCNASVQCSPGYFCNLPVMQVGGSATTGRCGRCAKESSASGPCTIAGGCPTGSLCAFQFSLINPGQCIPAKALGESCTGRDICLQSICQNGICTAPKRSGVGEDCQGNPCDNALGLYCNQMTRKCEPNPLPAKVGDYCGLRRDGSSAVVSCEAGAACTGLVEGGFVRICEPASKEGEPCATQGDPLGRRCEPGLACEAGKCAVPVSLVCRNP